MNIDCVDLRAHHVKPIYQQIFGIVSEKKLWEASIRINYGEEFFAHEQALVKRLKLEPELRVRLVCNHPDALCRICINTDVECFDEDPFYSADLHAIRKMGLQPNKIYRAQELRQKAAVFL